MAKLKIWKQEGLKRKAVRRGGRYNPRPRVHDNVAPPKDINVAQSVLQSTWMLARTLQLAMQDSQAPLDVEAERLELHEMAEMLLLGAAEMDEEHAMMSVLSPEDTRFWMEHQKTQDWLPGLLPERSAEERAIDEQEELDELEAQLWEALMEEKEHEPETPFYY
jgi:hypothetical protein